MDIIFDEITTQTLAELEKTQKEFWNIPRKTGVLINMFIKMMGIKNALEIGTSNGYSGLWIAKALKQTGGKLTTIEYYDKRQSVAIGNFEKCGVADIVRPLQGSACEILETLAPEEKFDFVFIDANKREYVKYFELVKPQYVFFKLTPHSSCRNNSSDKLAQLVNKLYIDFTKRVLLFKKENDFCQSTLIATQAA